MAACFAIGDFCAATGVWELAAVLAAVLIILWVFAYLRHLCKAWHFSIIIFLFLGFGISVYQRQCTIETFFPSYMDGQTVTLCGKIKSLKEKPSSVTFVLDGRVLVTVSKDTDTEAFGTGDIVSVTGVMEDFDSACNKGEFDRKIYYNSMGIYARCSCAGNAAVIVQPNKNRITAALFRFKKRVATVYAAALSDQDKGILQSIVLGDKTELDDKIQTLYQRNGIAHILAISGLHVSVIGMCLYRLLRRLGTDFKESAVVSMGIILCYGILTGNGTSTVRAAVMFGVYVAANILGRHYDILSAAALASLVLLVPYPLLLFQSGFLLSFGAVAGIVLLAPVLKMLLPEWEGSYVRLMFGKLWDSLCVSAAVSIATLPVVLCSFYEFPIYSVLFNLFVIPLMGLVMAGGVIGGIAGMICPPLGVFFLGVSHYVLQFYEMSCRWLVSLPFGHCMPGAPSVTRIVLYYGFLLSALLLHQAIRSVSFRRFTVILCFLAAMVLMLWQPIKEPQFHLLSVGQGDSSLIKLPGGTNILLDAGSSDKKELARYTVIPSLKANGCAHLSLVFVTHADADHISGIMDLLSCGTEYGITIDTLVLADIKEAARDEPYEKLVQTAQKNHIAVQYISAGTDICLEREKLVIRCLHPASDAAYSDRNEASFVLRFCYGEFSILYTGDIEGQGEQDLLKNNVLAASTVLKVAHHGSANATTEEFLEIVRPKLSVISCGKNNRYGHPAPELLDRLQNTGTHILCTMEQGEVLIETDGKSYHVCTYSGTP